MDRNIETQMKQIYTDEADKIQKEKSVLSALIRLISVPIHQFKSYTMQCFNLHGIVRSK
jgi:hypothetical protein